MGQCFIVKAATYWITAYKYCSLVQQSKQTIKKSEICRSNSSERVRGDVMRKRTIPLFV